jgi:3-phosphoglycerate kinase
MKNTGHNLVIRVDLGASAKDAEVITFDNIAQHIDPIIADYGKGAIILLSPFALVHKEEKPFTKSK